jgi:radical SAM protein with 4Fe4S-binding SPASM domain
MTKDKRWILHLDKRDRRVGEHPLRYLFLEVTRRCNLRCAYCGSSCEITAPAEELSTRQWCAIIDQIAADFYAPQVMVAVTGGEPFARKDLFDIFTHLQERGFHYGMVTNGTYITPKKAERLVQAGIGSISLSMDAPPAINDEIRGSSASEKVALAITALRNAGYRGILEVISTVTHRSIPHLETMRRHLAKLRVSKWRLGPVIPIGRCATRDDLILTPEDICTLLAFTKNSRSDRCLPAPEMAEEGYLGDDFEGVVRPNLCACNAGITVGGILHDGRIGACPELTDAFTQGHIARDRFKDVWENGYQDLRDRSWTHKGACATCDVYHRCQGGALHLYEDTNSEFIRCLYLMQQQGSV